MINKFRFKKPPQALSEAGGEDGGKMYGTLTRKDKTGSLKRQKADFVFSSCLDAETKRKLRELFSELQHSPAKALPPDSLRKALADSFLDQQKFQIGFMDDAAECFENMLLRIHDHIAHREPEDACSAPHCVPHQKFAMTLVEQSVCDNCGATSEPMSFTQMVQYVSTSTLVHQLRVSVGQTGRPDTFGRLLQKAGNMGDTRQCPASCGSITQMCRVLMNHPEIVSIGLVWNSEKPSLDHIMEVFSCIDTSLKLNHVFSNVTDTKWAETTTHNLVGVVTYYGKHYSTFFFHTKLMEWIFLDDATVRDVGPRWEQVVEKCRKGKFQPLLLLYATPDGTPVNLEYAPKLNTPFYTDKTKPHMPITNQQLLRRSVTPSPEKPNVGTTRRAITPNPDNSPLNPKPPLPKHNNSEYQNLMVIQRNISNANDSTGCDQVDGCIIQKEPEYVTRKCLEGGKPQVNVHRTLSNGSSSGVESGVCISDHANMPRRRDSGNWSGDRNSASSASSTTMENPYLYLVGKMPHGSLPGSPTRVKGDFIGGNNGAYDAGYDSYSLSSNDSTNMTTLQHMMKTGHLAQIPEDYSNLSMHQNSQSCDVLCDEADELLVKSRQLEDAHDLVLALALCNAAATKARAAMNAPYNNPQTLTLARMKHNTCIMRARSLHRRMTQAQNQNKDNSPEIRHTREGSSGSGRHSRQNSKDKGQHSRQNSRELLLQQEKEKAKSTKSIEIYATLPKKKDALRAKMNSVNIEDEEYALYNNKTPERESRSIFSRPKSKDAKVKEKRSRSEDRNKISRGDFSIAPEIVTAKDTLKKNKENNKEKDEKKDKDGKNKKQHKIRRKLLMGGLIRRKNRSMPDLTDSNAEDSHRQSPQCGTVDDGNVGLRGSPETSTPGMSGYLSEGHLELAGATGNPNLERSKLMRKSFHGSAGKILTAAKVPPPPPLRTTSQLSRPKSNGTEVVEQVGERCHFDIYGDVNIYHNLMPFNQPAEEQSSRSLPYYGNSNSSYDEDSFSTPSSQMVVTQADVHHERTPEFSNGNVDSGLDEVDCLPSHSAPMLELPPYPSPGGSAIHSRQASEDFPPPPPPLDLSALEEYLPKIQQEPSSLLSQVQNKRHEILTHESETRISKPPPLLPTVARSSGDTWLRELQAKQAALRMKKSDAMGSTEAGLDEVNTQRYLPGETKVKSVKDLASKFENNDSRQPHIVSKPPPEVPRPVSMLDTMLVNQEPTKCSDVEPSTIAPEQIAQEIREVEMITSAVNKVFGNHQEKLDDSQKNRPQKKKSVSFCDQVILVATAEEQEEETYIPNPILERVLRSAANNPEAAAIRQELMSLREHSSGSDVPSSSPPSVGTDPRVAGGGVGTEQPLYVRRNSIENLLNEENPKYLPNNNNMYPSEMPPTQTQSYPSSSPYSYQQQPLPYQTRLDEQYAYRNPGLSNNMQHNEPNQPYGYYVRGYQECSPNNAQGSMQPHRQPVMAEYIPRTTPHLPPEHIPVNNYISGHQQMYGLDQGDVHHRQPPYQLIPRNSPVHPGYYSNARPPMTNGQMHSNYGYSSQRNAYNQQNIRQSTPSPSTYPTSTHPPSPVPSVSSCNNYHPAMYRGSPTTAGSVYQRVAPPNNDYPQNFSQIDQMQYQRQERPDVYQRVPPPHADEQTYPQHPKYSPYMQVPSPKHMLKKTVSFQPGTKGCESPIPKPVVTPIVVNNANNSVPTDKTKCSLCRKKNVVALNVYCKDCEFYMSRFKPKS